VLGGFVLLAVFTGPYRTKPFVPQLVPIFEAHFGFIFAALQIGFCLFFKAKTGLLWMLGIWVLAVPLIYFTAPLSADTEGLSTFGRAVTGPACASAIALGIGALKAKL
jgi:hypothetical protein